MAFYTYKIAAGANNAAGLVNIEEITPSSDKAFFAPVAYSNYTPGQRKLRGSGTVYMSGFAFATWEFAVLTRKQFQYLQDTYCASGWSGEVTIATRVSREAYVNYSAVMILPDPASVSRSDTVFEKYPVSFTRLVAV